MSRFSSVFRPTRGWRRACAVVGVALTPLALAHAEPSTSDRAFAEGLFRDGRKLMAEGSIDEACAKFAESQRIAPALGTLLNLATCHEKQGRLATAWVEFDSVIAQAHRAGDAKRETFAVAHELSLRPRVSYLVVRAAAPPADLIVSIDGVEMRSSAMGTPLPVDAGAHQLEASAAGKQTWTSTVQVVGEATTVSVVIPALVEAPPPPAPPAPSASEVVAPPPPMASAAPSTSASASIAPMPSHAPATEPTAARFDTRPLGYTFLTVGAVGLAAGGYFGLRVLAKEHDADPHCPDKHCDATGASLIDGAKTSATWSTIGFGLGLASVVTGGALLLSAPRATEQAPTTARLRVQPIAGPSIVGLTISGAM